MNSSLRKEFVHTFFNFIKRPKAEFPHNDKLSFGESVIINHIFHLSHQNKSARVLDLRRFVDMSKSSLSQVLGGLEKKGYIERVISPNDKRGINLILTESGTEICKDNMRIIDGYLDELIERFGADDMRKLLDLLERLSDTANEINSENKEKESAKT